MNTPNLTASQLDYLVAALEHATWRDAAAAVGVSPSALSQGIAELERRLGVTLFVREGRRRVPTPEAERVQKHAKRILAELGELGRWADQVKGGAVGEVSIGMIDTAAIHHFGDTLMTFRQEHPDLTVRLLVQPSGQLLELLSQGKVDAIVAVDPNVEPGDGLITTPLIDEPLHVYAPPGTTVRASRPQNWGPWVGFPATSRTRARTARALRRRGVIYDVVAESSQPAVLREMVHLGMGWCVLPETDAESEPHALSRAVPDPIDSRMLTLVHRADREPTAALANLLTRLTI